MKLFVYRYVIPYLGLFFIRLISMTYRIRIIHPEIEQAIFDRGEVPIYISWHQRFFPGIVFFARRHRISIMISKSKDGEFIARIVKVLGWTPVRGSSSRSGVDKGGREALEELKMRALDGCTIGHIVDGPKGPFGVVKPGLLLIAQHSGMPILPAIVSAEKTWRTKGWDRYMLPKFFSRVIIRFDQEIYIPQGISGERFEELRRQIENRLYDLYHETDAMWERGSRGSRDGHE